MPSELQERAENASVPEVWEPPAVERRYVQVDLGDRLELRAESPDPTMPHSGRLIAYAKAQDGVWWVRSRDGETYALGYVGDDNRVGWLVLLDLEEIIKEAAH